MFRRMQAAEFVSSTIHPGKVTKIPSLIFQQRIRLNESRENRPGFSRAAQLAEFGLPGWRLLHIRRMCGQWKCLEPTLACGRQNPTESELENVAWGHSHRLHAGRLSSHLTLRTRIKVNLRSQSKTRQPSKGGVKLLDTITSAIVIPTCLLAGL